MAYRWDADFYQQKHAFVYQYGTGLVECLNPRPGEKILDVGCGTGELTDQLRQLGAEVVGIDQSASMIRQAQRQYPDIPFHVMDAARLTGLPQFDAIFSNAALHWMLEPEAVIRQLFDHLTPGGRLVVEFGGKGNIQQLISALNQQRIRYGYAPIGAEKQWFFPSLGEYSRLLERAGFQVQSAQYFHRDTPLADAQDGVKDWLRMFGRKWLEDVSADEQDWLLQSAQDALYPTLYRDGIWYADYKRLRVIAVKENTKL